MEDHCYALIPVEKLLVQIIYHSMHLRTIVNKNSCNCQDHILWCLVTVKKQWQDDFIDFEAAINYFLRSNYLAILSDAEEEKTLLENVYNFIKRK